MNIEKLSKLFVSMMVILNIYGCDAEKQINVISKQSEIIQGHVEGMASACIGKLSMNSKYTGDPKRPVVFEMNCDEMDKEHTFLQSMSEEEVEVVKQNIRDLSGIKKPTKNNRQRRNDKDKS